MAADAVDVGLLDQNAQHAAKAIDPVAVADGELVEQQRAVFALLREHIAVAH